MFVSWLLFPVLLAALCFGCGLLLEAAVGRRLPAPLLAPAGFAVLVVVAGLFTSRGETASLATPAVVLLALAGAALAFPWRGRGPGRWALAAALGVFVVYAAPVVFSGDPTFTGYIKLDDTATWMAFVDRVIEHGRDLSGLEPSSYQTTLQVNLPEGYPVGAFLPLGVGTQLTGTDVAWLVQPYMATMAALLGLCLYWLVTPLLESRPLRALVAFGAAQSALLFAYSLWGGIKELAVALAIAVLAAVAPEAAKAGWGWRAVLPAAIATTALLTMVGSGGLVWIAPVLGLVAVALWRERGWRPLFARAWPLVLTVLLLGVPALFAAGAFSPTQGGLTSAAELGNLISPLSIAQYVGVWIGGDFRLDPIRPGLTDYLIVLALLAAVAGAGLAWRRRAWGLMLYAIGAGAGSIAVFLYSSPWVGAKALASGSPSLLLLALAGAAAFAARVERVLGTTVLALVLAGVLWSNALGYHDVSLAPYAQLRELESIGEEFAGEGPALMTEYQPYGARHFLRDLDAEGASELRARPVPLVAGGELEKGEWGDTDQIALVSLLTYRTLVLRRSPAQSRPPSAYSLVRRGDYYDVWQRPAKAVGGVVEHLPLGDFEDPTAEPECTEVLHLAALAGPGGAVAAVERPSPQVVSLAQSAHPESWLPTEPDSPDLVPHGPGTALLQVDVKTGGRYGFYLQGSVRNPLTLRVDGTEVGTVEQQLNESQQFLYFGRLPLRAGRHEVELELADQSLAPGSGGPAEPIGPLVLNPVEAEYPVVKELPAAQAESFCGHRLDWVEALSNAVDLFKQMK
ncbi:MAG TPA: hypothetical protein VFR04_09330 [Solirubrobacterales bacterium]|nr:hypothetical protein [Solirubrobacterales bacterium]